MSGAPDRVKKDLALVVALTCALLSFSCAAPTPREPSFSLHEKKVADVERSAVAGLWLVTALSGNHAASQQKTIIQYHSDGTVASTVGPAATKAGGANLPRLAISGRWVIHKSTIKHSDMVIRSVDHSIEGQMLSELLNNSGRELGGTATILKLTPTHMTTVDTNGKYMQYLRYTTWH